MDQEPAVTVETEAPCKSTRGITRRKIKCTQQDLAQGKINITRTRPTAANRTSKQAEHPKNSDQQELRLVTETGGHTRKASDTGDNRNLN
jgi:hypothetical protein